MHLNNLKNASDPKQIKEATKKEQRGREREIGDLRFLLDTAQGRRVVWRILEYCKVFESIWHPSALIHHNSGKQDVGHFLMSEVMEARDEAFIKMMNEHKKEQDNG